MAALAAFGAGGRRCDVHCIRYRCGADAFSRSPSRRPCAGPAGAVGVGPAPAYQLTTVLNTLQDPSVSFAQQGITQGKIIECAYPVPATLADHDCKRSAAKGTCR